MVLLQEAALPNGASVVDGVGDEAGRDECLVNKWQDLPQQRVSGIAGLHPSDKSTRHEERKLTSRSYCSLLVMMR